MKEASVAKAQAETASKLADEKDKTIANLADKLSIAEEKAAGYDDLKKSEETAKNKIIELQKDMEHQKAEADRTLKASQEATDRELAGLKKDHETEIRELKADMERKISDAQKDAALSCANEVAKKEREMNTLLREADKANARLQVQLESLQDKIAELTAALDKAQGK